MATRVTVPLGPAGVDLTGIRAGDQNQISASLKQHGAAVNLTGLTLTAQARKKATDAEAAMTATVEVTNATAGQLTIRWPGEDVRTMLAGKATWAGVWDLQVASGAEDPLTVVAGKLTAEMDVTRP